ncbi:MAG: hypothetical protein ACJAZV_000660, partial [Roseivirga sp.]
MKVIRETTPNIGNEILKDTDYYQNQHD